MKLRDYQERCVQATVDEFANVGATLNVMPTGTGKTVTFAHTIARWCNGQRAMVIAHRDELIRQACQKIKAVCGIEAEVEMAEYRAREDTMLDRAPIIVSSVQTQNRGTKPRMLRFDPSEFNLLIIDEAHHAPAATYRRMIEHYRQNTDCKVLGVTATPDRADEVAMGTIFESCAFDYGLIDAIADGWLVDIDQQFIRVEGLDFSKCRTTAGDLNQKDMDAALMRTEEILHRCASPTMEIIGSKKALVFASSIQHADRLAEIFNRHRKESAFSMDCTMTRDHRRYLLDQYRAGKFQIMVNVGIATEGFDEPGIEAIVMARPTKSRCLYAQMVGRGTRPAQEIVGYINDCAQPASRRTIIAGSSKPSLLVLDFVGNAGRHKLISSADILGGNFEDPVVERARRKAQEAGGAIRMSDALRLAQEEIKAEAERQRAHMVAKAAWSAKNINPFDVFGIAPHQERGWHEGKRPTDRMIQVLQRAKIDGVEGLSMAKAGELIGELKRRWNANLCTYAQAKVLKKFGENAECTMAEASAKIDAIKANGWRPLSPSGSLQLGRAR